VKLYGGGALAMFVWQ